MKLWIAAAAMVNRAGWATLVATMHERAAPSADHVDHPTSEVHDDRHATNLELFLDLVFVFAVTQITTLLVADLGWAGAGRAALLAWLVWWQWSQFTWAGAAADLERRRGTRALVLLTIPAALVMAIAIPSAYADRGAWFGGAYVAVQLLVLAMQGVEAMKGEHTRRAFLTYASLASLAPVAVAVGGALPVDVRTAVWGGAALINIVGALRAGGDGEWAITPSHFAERHALIVIIALGEVVVAVGATASGLGLDGTVALGAATAVAGACTLWWAYFSFLPALGERALHQARGARRGVVARDLFTFGHFPLIAGLIGYAAVAKHVVPHPGDPLGDADRVVLGASMALVLGGLLHIHARIVGRVGPARLAAPVAAAAITAAGGALPGAALVVAVMTVVALAQLAAWRELRRLRVG